MDEKNLTVTKIGEIPEQLLVMDEDIKRLYDAIDTLCTILNPLTDPNTEKEEFIIDTPPTCEFATRIYSIRMKIVLASRMVYHLVRILQL